MTRSRCRWTGKRGCGLYGCMLGERLVATLDRGWHGWVVVLMVNPETGKKWTIRDGKRIVERIYGATETVAR